METQRLRAIQHPNRGTTLLESWASSQDIIPVKVRRMSDNQHSAQQAAEAASCSAGTP
jgi:hypothetical protein